MNMDTSHICQECSHQKTNSLMKQASKYPGDDSTASTLENTSLSLHLSLNAGAPQRLQIYWGFYILILIMHHKNCSHGSHIFHSLCPSHGSEWPHLWPSLSSSIRDLQQKAVRNTFHALPVVITWNLKDHSSSWKIWETSQQLQNQILFIFYKHAKFHSYKPEVSMDYANRLLRFLFCFSSIDMPQSWNSTWPNIHRLEARTLTSNKKIWNAMSSRSTTIHKHYLHY